MIGCDKCDEWYHFACVGIDITQIPDMETYEFTCPSCKEKEANKGKKSAKKSTQPPKNAPASQSQTTINKRDVKAASKQAAAPSNGI
jgi:hypothetical protein